MRVLVIISSIFAFNAIDAQTDTAIIKSNNPYISMDHNSGRYMQNGKLLNGTIMSNDTIIYSDKPYDFYINYTLTKYCKGKISRIIKYYENGQLASDAKFDTTTLDLELPFCRFDRDGKLNMKYYHNIDSNIVMESYRYFEDGTSIKHVTLYNNKNESISPKVEFDVNTQMPLGIVYHSKIDESALGYWINFSENNDFRIESQNLYIKPSILFEEKEINYFANGFIKQIIRKCKINNFVEIIEFDILGDIVKWEISENSKTIYKYK